MNMWVFRLAAHEGGNPQGICPVNLNHNHITNTINNTTPTRLDYEKGGGAIHFLCDELSNLGKLRQGWGIPGLDLTLSDKNWIENYIINSYQYWEEKKIPCNKAMGRKTILNRMLDMNIDDIIFIPNISQKERNTQYFAVVTVKEKYYFENRSNKPNTWEKDFGHIIDANKIKYFKYSQNTILRSTFGAPFMHAIDPIGKHYQSYSIFKAFIQQNYP